MQRTDELRTLQTTVKGLKVRNDPDLTHIGELFTRRNLPARSPYSSRSHCSTTKVCSAQADAGLAGHAVRRRG